MYIHNDVHGVYTCSLLMTSCPIHVHVHVHVHVCVHSIWSCTGAHVYPILLICISRLVPLTAVYSTADVHTCICSIYSICTYKYMMCILH